VPHGARLDAGEVRSRPRLRHADADQQLATDRRRQIAALLLLRSVGHEVRKTDRGVHRRHETVGAPPRGLLHDDRVVEKLAAAPTVRGREARPEEALRAEPPPGVAVGDAVPVPALDLRLDLALAEALELRTEHLVLGREHVATHAIYPIVLLPR